MRLFDFTIFNLRSENMPGLPSSSSNSVLPENPCLVLLLYGVEVSHTPEFLTHTVQNIKNSLNSEEILISGFRKGIVVTCLF